MLIPIWKRGAHKVNESLAYSLRLKLANRIYADIHQYIRRGWVQ